MTSRREGLLVSRRDGGGMSRYLALLAIGLLAMTGCGGQVGGTPMEQAQAAFERGQWDPAVAACSEAIAQNPQDSAAYLLRGRAQHLAGRLDLAVADLTDAIRLNPQDPEAYYQRATPTALWAKSILRMRTTSKPVSSTANTPTTSNATAPSSRNR